MKFREIVSLTGIFIFSPQYFLPTLRATKNTLKNCNVRYGELHHSNDLTNAYRHALWNLLICEECFKVTGNVEKTINWARKITDLHEELSPNLPLEKAMDLHNNRIGREIFKDSFYDKRNSGELLDQKMREAVKIDHISQLQNRETQLIFIESREK
ncbi:hypothetical protein FK178_11810 [Antarcticibacterium arcticum]|uniref:DUF6973 domain-containing protein n=1 Tax=Antarcticibacterium arcticum TaxID=2585771 RepID=A0A5B8YND6_9FLAO|nr:hypothetical protein [Antarcticibacterium arcticum]QED38357.1 hypothetical protein FK178_11810 [Antarcticibacterium arcticum]